MNEEILWAIICKNTDKFYKLEKKLYNKYPNYRNIENYYLVKGNKINKFNNLIENKIEDGDIITVNSIE